MTERTLLWIARAALVFAALDFGAIGLLYAVDPAREAAASTIVAIEAAGATNLRVGFGAFHLAIGVIASFCAINRDRYWPGLGIVVTVTTVAVSMRLIGVTVDGPHPRTMLLLQFETLGLAIFSAGLFAAWRLKQRAKIT
jgi:hypothetical protein